MASYYGNRAMANCEEWQRYAKTQSDWLKKRQVKFKKISIGISFLPLIHILHDGFQVGPCYTMSYVLTRRNTNLSLQIQSWKHQLNAKQQSKKEIKCQQLLGREWRAKQNVSAVLQKSMVCQHSEFCAGFCSSQRDEERVEKIQNE